MYQKTRTSKRNCSFKETCFLMYFSSCDNSSGVQGHSHSLVLEDTQHIYKNLLCVKCWSGWSTKVQMWKRTSCGNTEVHLSLTRWLLEKLLKLNLLTSSLHLSLIRRLLFWHLFLQNSYTAQNVIFRHSILVLSKCCTTLSSYNLTPEKSERNPERKNMSPQVSASYLWGLFSLHLSLTVFPQFLSPSLALVINQQLHKLPSS